MGKRTPLLHHGAMAKQLNVYGDTNTLRGNVSDATEREALEKIVEDKSVKLFTSHLVNHEATNTPDKTKRNTLMEDHKSREKVAKDEKLLGFHSFGDRFTWICSPLISDVQDEALHEEIMRQGIKRIDAMHLTQAACNKCNIFLTGDGAIIRRRQWLEQRLGVRILRPSELVGELGPEVFS
jgi:predicted nucleic acid-binding protein